MNAPAVSSVLVRIAQREGIDAAAVYLDGETVFYRSPDGLRTVCQVGTDYWLEVWCELVAEAVIARCARP